MLADQRILIDEDAPHLRELLSLRCRSLGETDRLAGDAFEAVSIVEDARPHVAILDVGLPKGNGLALAEMIAQNPDLGDVPTIVLTAKASPETVRRCHELGAYYVPKGADLWGRVEPLLRELLGDQKSSDLANRRPRLMANPTRRRYATACAATSA